MRYIGGESYFINDKLRRGNKLTHDELLWVETLDMAIRNMPAYKGLVCRSIAINGDELKDFLESYQTGKIIQYNAFTSATKFRDAKDCYNPEAKVQIFIQSNSGRDISSLNPGESEVLYTLRSKFRVKAIEENGNLYYILLEEI